MALSTFNLCAAPLPGGEASHAMVAESNVSPVKEAALTLQDILCQYPKYFVSNSAITALGGTCFFQFMSSQSESGTTTLTLRFKISPSVCFYENIAGWEASYAACNRPGAISIEDRKALCIAICNVLAALPDNQRVRSFHALALPALDCFEKMSSIANTAIATSKSQNEIDAILGRLADEAVIFTTMARTFTNACIANDGSMESGCSTSSERRTTIPQPLLAIVRKVWPSLTHSAATYSHNEVRSEVLDSNSIQYFGIPLHSLSTNTPCLVVLNPQKK
jgi:hypothetical protein